MIRRRERKKTKGYKWEGRFYHWAHWGQVQRGDKKTYKQRQREIKKTVKIWEVPRKNDSLPQKTRVTANQSKGTADPEPCPVGDFYGLFKHPGLSSPRHPVLVSMCWWRTRKSP